MMCAECQPQPSAWRDFPEDQQRVMRNLLRRMHEAPGKRYEIVLLRDGRVEIAAVTRQIIAGRGVG